MRSCQKNDGTTLCGPIALIGVTLSAAWPAPAVITMISVRTPVPLLMETVLAMMRSRTCEGTCGLMGVTAAEDGDWAESSRQGRPHPTTPNSCFLQRSKAFAFVMDAPFCCTKDDPTFSSLLAVAKKMC